MPSWPSSVLVLRITLATGTTAVGIAVIAASAGTYIAAMPKRTWSAVVLTVDESRPEASAGGPAHTLLRARLDLACGASRW